MPYMKTSLQKLIAYSTQAGTFLALPTAGIAQVVYHNIDPDSIFENDGSITIDFNDDGLIDLQITEVYEYDWTFWTSYTLVWWGAFSAHISNFSGIVANTDYPDSFGALNLMSGFSITNSENWNTTDEITLIDFSSYMSSMYTPGYFNWYGNNQYIGVRFDIAGEEHYGWVRLSITNNGNSVGIKDYSLAVQDFAYEATPGVPLIIENPTASIAENVFITDAYEYGDASDFRVQFDNADLESTISAYRIYIYRYNYPEYFMPSLAFLETLPSERYMEILPTGAPTYNVMLPATMTDVDGNPIESGYHYYRAIIVSLADGVMVSANNVSLPSNPILHSLVDVPNPYSLHIYLTGDNCDISDFTVSFHRADDETYISEYRVYILNGDHDHIAENDPVYFTRVIPNGSETYVVHPDSGDLVFSDSIPILYERYYTEIMTVGDSIHVTNADFHSTRYYETYYGDIAGTEIEMYCAHNIYTPVISFVDFTKTPADIRLQFTGPAKTGNMGPYKIFIVPEENISDFSPDMADAVSEGNYYKIIHLGVHLDITLPGDLPDINGNKVALDKRYAIMIGIYEYGTSPRVSISQPSEIFNLMSDELHVPLPYSFLYENQLYVMSNGDLPYILNLYNMAGEQVMSWEITEPITIIDLSDLSKGIYVIKGTPADEMPATKVFVGHAAY